MKLFGTYLGLGKNDLHFCYEQCDGCGHCGRAQERDEVQRRNRRKSEGVGE